VTNVSGMNNSRGGFVIPVGARANWGSLLLLAIESLSFAFLISALTILLVEDAGVPAQRPEAAGLQRGGCIRG
jgi:hypothetical protein